MKFDAFVPQVVPNNCIMAFFSMVAFLTRISNKERTLHKEKNAESWATVKNVAMDSNGKYIEHQNQMERLIYGKQKNYLSKGFLNGRPLTGKENTCEVIAVYNALTSLGQDSDNFLQKNNKTDIINSEENSILDKTMGFVELLHYFEKNGIALNGYFGTSPRALIRFFKKHSYTIKVLKGKAIKEDVLRDLQAADEGAYILTTFNDKNSLFAMVHTMCITREDNKFVMHNDYAGTKTYASLEDAIFQYNNGKGKPIMVIKVTK